MDKGIIVSIICGVIIAIVLSILAYSYKNKEIDRQSALCESKGMERGTIQQDSGKNLYNSAICFDKDGRVYRLEEDISK